MKVILILCLILTASVATAAPFASVYMDSENSPSGLFLFKFNLDPNGETNYTAVEFIITPGPRTKFENVSSATPIYQLPSDASGAIGVGTVTAGYTFLGYGADTVRADGIGFTFTSFGGSTSAFSGDLAQVTFKERFDATTYRFRFADADGNILDDFTIRGALLPEPATAGLAGLALAGVLGFRRRR